LTALFKEGDLLQLLCVHSTSAEWRAAESSHRYVTERLKVVLVEERHKPTRQVADGAKLLRTEQGLRR
jgi:hypothetical protein